MLHPDPPTEGNERERSPRVDVDFFFYLLLLFLIWLGFSSMLIKISLIFDDGRKMLR